MDSIEQLIGYYNKSNEDDMYHVIAGHILSNIHQIEHSTIYDLADMCYSSPSTISRLMKKMEFDNYTDFKTKIHYALDNYRYLNQNVNDTEMASEETIVDFYFDTLKGTLTALQNTINYEQIAELSTLLYQAEKVFFYSYPEVQLHILQKALIVSGKRSYIYDSIASQERSLTKVKEGTVIFAVIPNLVEMASMRSILKKARLQGATIITICSERRNDYAKYSDVQLCFDGTKTAMDLYSFMTLINVIKYDYSTRFVNHLLEELYD